MITTLNTLRKYNKYIKNTLEQPYSNGVIERIIKREYYIKYSIPEYA